MPSYKFKLLKIQQKANIKKPVVYQENCHTVSTLIYLQLIYIKITKNQKRPDTNNKEGSEDSWRNSITE